MADWSGRAHQLVAEFVQAVGRAFALDERDRLRKLFVKALAEGEEAGRSTSPEVASRAAGILADDSSTPAEKSVAGSALSQAEPETEEIKPRRGRKWQREG